MQLNYILLKKKCYVLSDRVKLQKKKIIISANVIFLFIKTKIKKTTTTPHFVKIREIALKSFWYFSVSVSTRLCELFDGYDIQKQPKSQ